MGRCKKGIKLCNASQFAYSERHDKFLLPARAKAIYESFCKAESEISNVVDNKIYKKLIFMLKSMSFVNYNKFS